MTLYIPNSDRMYATYLSQLCCKSGCRIFTSAKEVVFAGFCLSVCLSVC